MQVSCIFTLLVCFSVFMVVIFPQVKYINLNLKSISTTRSPKKEVSRTKTPKPQVPRTKSPKLQCPPGHVLTVQTGAQLGNRIWEYLSLLAIYKLYENGVNFSVHIPKRIKSSIELLFGRIRSFPTYDYPNFCQKKAKAYVLKIREQFQVKNFTSKEQPLVIMACSVRYDEIVEYGVDKIKNELKLRDVHVNYSNDALRKIKANFNISHNNVTYVGIHYRGTDYISFLRNNYKSFTDPPNATYYLNAMKYFKNNYQEVIFILMTIDKKWLKINLPLLRADYNLAVNYNRGDRVKDLVMLSMCNHSIINYGTFGSTAALFAGGTTFVYDLKIPLDHRGSTVALGLAHLLPNWHAIR